MASKTDKSDSTSYQLVVTPHQMPKSVASTQKGIEKNPFQDSEFMREFRSIKKLTGSTRDNISEKRFTK
jgi:hypothetical protein